MIVTCQNQAFLKVSCKDCGNETIIFSRASSEISLLSMRKQHSPGPRAARADLVGRALSLKSSSEGGRDLARKQAWPEEGDLLVCIVKSVSDKGALPRDRRTRWSRGIRIHRRGCRRVGQIRQIPPQGRARVVAKAIGVKQDRGRIDLSIKSVSDERRRDALQYWKNEQRAGQMMKVAAERVNWSEDEPRQKSDDLVDAFGSLYGALEEAASDPKSLSGAGFSGDWTATIIEACRREHRPRVS